VIDAAVERDVDAEGEEAHGADLTLRALGWEEGRSGDGVDERRRTGRHSDRSSRGRDLDETRA